MKTTRKKKTVAAEPVYEPVHLTEDGIRKLKDKLTRLKSAVPNLAAEAQRTAAYGDRSDNAEYKLAKGALRRTNWQILEMEDQLKRVVPIAAGPADSGTVEIGSTVVLECADGARKRFRILGSHESDPARGRISYGSPLGAALVGRVKGDHVTVLAAGGSRTYRIIEIE
jgi:transcription elongation factor GreA